MHITDFKKLVFIGAGQFATDICEQNNVSDRVAAVGELTSGNERIIKTFRGHEVVNASELTGHFADEDTAVVIAMGYHRVDLIAKTLINEYHVNKARLFVPNPYVALRTFNRDNDYVSEERTEISSSLKSSLREWFSESLSARYLDEMLSAVPWDKPGDTIDVKYYPDIEPLYFYSEDYWHTYPFGESAAGDKATVIDCGAYTGDSVKPICTTIPQSDILYYGLEPSQENYKYIFEDEYIKAMGDRFRLLKYGAGEKNGECFFFLKNDHHEVARFIKDEKPDTGIKISLEIRKIDDLDLEIQGQLYIKMDIEGSELDALKGAENTIKKHRPFLAICLYHKKNDLADIPAYIMSIADNYNLYLRGGYHTILWAIPAEKDNQ